MDSINFPYLSNLSRKIWEWYAEYNLFIFASYIFFVQNFEADTKSRIISQGTECFLNLEYFNEINNQLGSFDINLFSSSVTTKCPYFVSWFPDSLAFTVDAFSLGWSTFGVYTFPSFILILRVLWKKNYYR